MMHAALQRRQASTRMGKVSDATPVYRCTIIRERQAYVIILPEACRVTKSSLAFEFFFSFFFLDEATGDKSLLSGGDRPPHRSIR